MWIDGPTKSFTASGALAKYRRVRLNGGLLEYAGAANTDAIGVVVNDVFALGDVASVWARTKQGTVPMVASGIIGAGVAVYAAANGKVSGAGNVLVGVALTGATADGDVIEVMCSTTAVLGPIARTALSQDDLEPYTIPASALRVWDAPSTALPAAAANDDLGVYDNTFLTAAPTVEAGDAKAAKVTRKARFMFAVPPEYVAGQTITLRVNAGMKTTVSDKTATLDAEVVRQAAPAVDICATAAQSINNLVAANKDFVITPDNVVPGDVLDVVLTVEVDDGATGTAVIGKINNIAILADIKG